MTTDSTDIVDGTTDTETAGTDAQTDTLVRVQNLKTYYQDRTILGGNPVKAVDGVNLTIRRGETVGLVGESGCGKTTFGRTLVRLEDVTDGTINYDGVDITTLRGDDLKQWRRNAQMVFQDPNSSLNDRMTVGEIIREPLDAHSWKTSDERVRHVRELLKTVGLAEEHYYRYPHQFSGGQRQRISIARALALEPDFIVLDEPVSALDASVQAKILNLLMDLQNEFGLTYLFIAHDLSVVRHVCDRVMVMYLGNIMERGPTEELFTDPSNPYTKSLLSAIPRPDPTVEVDRITLRGTPPSPRDPPTGCAFSTRCPMKIRPEEYRELDDDTWAALNAFWEILRERSRSDRTVTERARELLGLKTRFESVDEISAELFGDIEMPPDAREIIDEALAHLEDGREEKAIDIFSDAFGSVCDKESPEEHVVKSREHVSRCHRHREAYADPEPVLDRSTLDDY
jgi:peptide/nickel transport system ATP-binding protein